MLTGFNMEEENEEGHINAGGDFVAKKKDIGEEADAWLDGVSMHGVRVGGSMDLCV